MSGLRNDDRGNAFTLRHQMDLERGERTRRRSGDVAPGQVIGAAVTVAPHAVALLLESDDAVEVRAGGGEGAIVVLGGTHDDDGIGAEADDLESLFAQ